MALQCASAGRSFSHAGLNPPSRRNPGRPFVGVVLTLRACNFGVGGSGFLTELSNTGRLSLLQLQQTLNRLVTPEAGANTPSKLTRRYRRRAGR